MLSLLVPGILSSVEVATVDPCEMNTLVVATIRCSIGTSNSVCKIQMNKISILKKHHVQWFLTRTLLKRLVVSIDLVSVVSMIRLFNMLVELRSR